jgi:hypothetical protein
MFAHDYAPFMGNKRVSESLTQIPLCILPSPVLKSGLLSLL